MKIKEGFVLRNVADSVVVVPVSGSNVDFNGMITLNATGGFLWKQLETDKTREQLVEALMGEYGIDEADFLTRLDDMTEQAFDDQCTGANPRYPLMSEIKQMYLNAYYGKKA